MIDLNKAYQSGFKHFIEKNASLEYLLPTLGALTSAATSNEGQRLEGTAYGALGGLGGLLGLKLGQALGSELPGGKILSKVGAGLGGISGWLGSDALINHLMGKKKEEEIYGKKEGK